MTTTKPPARLDSQFDEVWFVAANGQTEQMTWDIEGIEGDHATAEGSFEAHTVADMDAIIADMMRLRTLMAQAEAVCGV